MSFVRSWIFPALGKLRVGGGMCLLWPLLLVACTSSSQVPDTRPQHWNDLDVRVESRPSPPTAGMNEFLVILTDSRGQPGWDCLVDIRTAQADPWKQAIQDGRVGVYRRSALLAPGERSVVQVRVSRGTQQAVLRFPIHLTPGG